MGEWMRAAAMRPLGDRDLDVLRELRAACDAKYCANGVPKGWARPLDCGAADGSHHSSTLAKLVRHGYAEARQRGALASNSRGSKLYRITDDGRRFLSLEEKICASR